MLYYLHTVLLTQYYLHIVLCFYAVCISDWTGLVIFIYAIIYITDTHTHTHSDWQELVNKAHSELK